MKSLNEFLKIHKMATDKLRLGQRFCNLFIKKPQPELYYNENDNQAILMIQSYLIDHCYIETLPPVLTDDHQKVNFDDVIKNQKGIANRVIEKLSELGCEFILAGGAPRNWFFKRPANDLDFWVKENSIDVDKLEKVIVSLSDEKKFNITPGNFENPIMIPVGIYSCIDGVDKTYNCIIDGLSVQFIVIDCKTRNVVEKLGSSICMFWYDKKEIHSNRMAKFSILTKTIYYRDDFDDKKEYTHIKKMKKYFPDFIPKKMSDFSRDFNNCKNKRVSDAVVCNEI